VPGPAPRHCFISQICEDSALADQCRIARSGTIASMSARVIDGKAVAARLREEYKARIAKLHALHRITPGLAVILVGENAACQVYVKHKVADCEGVGMHSVLDRHPATLPEAELLARIRALSRRHHGSGQPLLTNGIVSLDPVSKRARIGAHDVALSAREFALLRELLVRPGAVLSREQLENRIYGWGEEVESNVVEYIIHGLRRKLGSDCIRNVRGLGWMVPRSADTEAHA